MAQRTHEPTHLASHRPTTRPQTPTHQQLQFTQQLKHSTIKELNHGRQPHRAPHIPTQPRPPKTNSRHRMPLVRTSNRPHPRPPRPHGIPSRPRRPILQGRHTPHQQPPRLPPQVQHREGQQDVQPGERHPTLPQLVTPTPPPTRPTRPNPSPNRGGTRPPPGTTEAPTA